MTDYSSDNQLHEVLNSAFVTPATKNKHLSITYPDNTTTWLEYFIASNKNEDNQATAIGQEIDT